MSFSKLMDMSPNTSAELKEYLKHLPTKPGVYQMFDASGEIIYVGKAKQLKKRVNQYFQKKDQDVKTQQLVEKIHHIEVILTQSEHEALLLESNLIKTHHPRYNIIFKDDKSYPYLFISEHPYPRLDFHRGQKKAKGEYFGPYPSAGSVRQVLNLMQRLFRIRQCRDSYFKSRTRPCLQYQINRCTAPCVEYISEADYAKAVMRAKLFLQGKSQTIIDELVDEMQLHSDALEFEEAARIRDLISQLRDIVAEQHVTKSGGNIDVFILVRHLSHTCIQGLFIRGGRLIGGKAYFPKVPGFMADAPALQGFLAQYYLNNKVREIPDEIILAEDLPEQALFTQVLSEQKNKKVHINTNTRGKRSQWLAMAMNNANSSLRYHAENKHQLFQRFEDLTQSFSLDEIPHRIECFDVSHSQGEATQAACVAYNLDGPMKSFYRRYNIQDVQAGDDYAAMYQALERHFKKLIETNKPLPDLLIIDGGKGQLTQAQRVLNSCEVDSVLLIGIAKGEGRRAINDKILLLNSAEPLSVGDATLHLIQEIRNEAHRFAITGHRNKRDKRRITSTLEQIEGIGPQRRTLLLKQFGGMQGLKKASLRDLEKVSGISKELAKRIYQALND